MLIDVGECLGNNLDPSGTEFERSESVEFGYVDGVREVD
jgi:hypothetical protein